MPDQVRPKGRLRVLMLEDNPADAELVEAVLERAGLGPWFERVDDERQFLAALRDFDPDVILSDHSAGQFSALAALQSARAHGSSAPFIVVTGAINAPSTVAVIRAGAEDVILKSSLARLPRAVESAAAGSAVLRSLSPRQVEVLRLVVQGLSTRETAARLGLSVKTVDSHRTALMKRLDVHDVVMLVRFAFSRGLVPRENTP